jgi:hypothetical protein
VVAGSGGDSKKIMSCGEAREPNHNFRNDDLFKLPFRPPANLDWLKRKVEPQPASGAVTPGGVRYMNSVDKHKEW